MKKARTYKEKVKDATKSEHLTSHTIYLTENDQISYVYKRDHYGEINEVTNVSLEIKISDKWITIIRYDSSHGFLHRHMAISKDNSSDTPIGIEYKGSHSEWLTWAINDIKKNYTKYKNGFVQRSNIDDIDNI